MSIDSISEEDVARSRSRLVFQGYFTQDWDHKRDLKFLTSQDMSCLLNFSRRRGEVEIGNTFVKSKSLKTGITSGIFNLMRL